jgi:septal ring factor EnvC (AmiA/AmiB activator)
VALLVSTGYDNYVSSVSDPVMSAKLKAFLESMLPDIKASQLQAEIGVQEEAVRDAEKDYKKKDKEGNKQSREKEHLDKDIAENVSDKAKTAETLDAEKEKLENLKDQKK